MVFISRFFEFFDANTWMLFEAAIGVKRQDITATFNIMGIPLVDARANFLLPVKFGDIIGIASRISEFRRSSFDVEHHITIDGELAVDGGESRVLDGAQQKQFRKDWSRRYPERYYCPI